MSITPDEVANKRFIGSSDGYDKNEVHAFLAAVARQQEQLRSEIDRLRAGSDISSVGDEVASVLSRASDTASALERAAQEKARALRERAEREAHELRKATEDSTARLRQEADRYSFETRSAADKAAQEQQLATADRIGRLLAGESRLRERLYNLEVTLQGMRGELLDAAEAVYPDVAAIDRPRKNGAPLPPAVIDVRDTAAKGARPVNGSVV